MDFYFFGISILYFYFSSFISQCDKTNIEKEKKTYIQNPHDWDVPTSYVWMEWIYNL